MGRPESRARSIGVRDPSPLTVSAALYEAWGGREVGCAYGRREPTGPPAYTAARTSMGAGPLNVLGDARNAARHREEQNLLGLWCASSARYGLFASRGVPHTGSTHSGESPSSPKR